MTTDTTKRVPSGASGGATNRVTGSPAGGATRRVTGAITESTTDRVPTDVIGLGPFLLLEGDFEGALAFPTIDEESDPDGYLKLEGTY